VKAIQFSEFGGPEVLKVVDLPEPHRYRQPALQADVGLGLARTGALGLAERGGDHLLEFSDPRGIDQLRHPSSLSRASVLKAARAALCHDLPSDCNSAPAPARPA